MATPPLPSLTLSDYLEKLPGTTFRRLYHVRTTRPFTPMELGQAIQAAAPDRGSVALLVDGDEAEAQLWFYGDRALRTRIDSIPEFEQRIDDDAVDLVYNFDEQPWKGRAAGLVFPKICEGSSAGLHEYLKARYPLTALPPTLERHFDVFDLRRDSANRSRAAP